MEPLILALIVGVIFGIRLFYTDERDRIIDEVIRESEKSALLPRRHTRWINMERGLELNAGQYRRYGPRSRFIRR